MLVTAPPLPDHDDAARSGGNWLVGALTRYVLALLYGLALCYAYDVLSRWWAYFGFTYNLNSPSWRYAACFVAAAPAVLLEPRPRTFAQAAAWFIYALVYLPCLLVPVMQYSSDLSRLIQVFTATFVGCVVFHLLVRGDVKRMTRPTVRPQLFWGTLFAVWAAMLLLVVVSFGASFQFVAADDIYTQRFAAADSVTNPLVRYAIAFLSNAIDPFLVAAGLYTRRYWIAGAGAAAQIVLYGTLAAKAVLLSPIFVVGAFFLGDRNGSMRGNLLLVGLIVMFVATSPLLARYDPLGGSIDQLISLLYMRTLLISGATYGVYEQFFSVFPLTYFSNNNIISLFVTYPYGQFSVGQTVQKFLIPGSAIDLGELNANFLATDGLAALGVAGVPIISAGTALVLRVMSRFVQHGRTTLMLAAGTGFILSLANTSLLTSLITGGGIMLLTLVFIAPIERN